MTETFLRVAVLGPVQVASGEGALVDVPGANGKALIAALVLAKGAVVSVPSLVDDIWQDDPPRNGKAALQTLVSRVRAIAGDELIESVGGGYRLACDPSCVDLWAPGSPRRGEPGADLAAGELADRLRRVADSARASHLARRVESELDAGHAEAAAADARLLANASPYDEDAELLLMRALAASGRRNEAMRSFAEFRARLADELGTDPGDALVAFNVELLRQDPEPGVAVTGRTIGVRAAANRLIGRDGDIAELEKLLRTSRLTTILGAGGLGKTRLAQELANRAAGETSQVVVVELAGVREPEDVPLAVASTLGIGETSTGRLRLTDPVVVLEVRTRIVAALSERRTLLVLDNCEHVVEAAAYLVDEILAAVPTVTVLATSRAPLQISAEQVYPLEPLSSAGSGPAVRLFLERARAARPGASLPLDAVERLCERLDGLPLAIELAAARIRSMSLDEIERRLGNRFELLRGGDRSAPERHRTLLAVIDWSWNLLTDSQRRMLRRLCLFPDGFSAEAASAVLEAEGDAALLAADDLESLVSQSLVSVGENGATGSMRYRMLETVREFGGIELARAGDERAAELGMTEWARAFCLESVERFSGGSQARAIRRLELEHDNLLAVLRRELDADQPDASVVFPVFAALVVFWMVRNQVTEVLAFAWPVQQAIAGAEIPVDAADSAALTLIVSTALGVGVSRRAPGDELPVQLDDAQRSAAFRAGLRSGVRLRRLVRSGDAVSPWLRSICELLFAARRRDTVQAAVVRMRASDDATTRTLALLLSALLDENEGSTQLAVERATAAYEGAVELGSEWTAAQAAQTIAHLSSQSGSASESLRWAEIARAGFLELGAVEEIRQLDWVVAINSLKSGAGDEVREIFERYTFDDVDQQPGFDAFDMRSIGWAGLAEIEAAAGRIDDALGLYWRAADIVATAPRMRRLAPWQHLVTAGLLALAVRSGRTENPALLGVARALSVNTRVAHRLRGGSLSADRPVLGTAALGVAIWVLADGEASARHLQGLELLALAKELNSRQDLPALVRAPHLAAAAGPDLDRALAAAAGLDAEAREARAIAVLAGLRL